jgi:hypothetical protein
MKTIADLYELYIRFTTDLMTLDLNIPMYDSIGTVLRWAINFGTIPTLVLIGGAIAHARLDRGPRRAPLLLRRRVPARPISHVRCGGRVLARREL